MRRSLHSWTLIPLQTIVVADFQNFLRTQTGNTTTVNIIISTVDYLLRLQVRYALDMATHASLSRRRSKRLKCLVLGIHQRFLLVLLGEGHHRRGRAEELLQGSVCGQAGFQLSNRVHTGTAAPSSTTRCSSDLE